MSDRKPKRMTAEMNIGNAGRRPRMKPWIVVLKWTECPDGSYVSHDYRWKIVPNELFRAGCLYRLSPNPDSWDGIPVAELAYTGATASSLMSHAQDYSDGFRKHVWESIHGPYKPIR